LLTKFWKSIIQNVCTTNIIVFSLVWAHDARKWLDCRGILFLEDLMRT
jgi:hypothetical protein